MIVTYAYSFQTIHIKVKISTNLKKLKITLYYLILSTHKISLSTVRDADRPDATNPSYKALNSVT